MARVSQRLDTVRKIAAELDDRYSIEEIDEFASAFGLSADLGDWDNAYQYARRLIQSASPSILSEIVDDLGIDAPAEFSTNRQMPAIWESTDKLRVFISHLSSQKDKASRLRDVMQEKGMAAFVAHEDIEPTLEWQVQIERALNNMELFVSMHTKGFSSSVWTQQEIGYAAATGVKIIALRMEEDPTGFIQKHQALSRGQKTAPQVAAEIIELVKKDERLRERYQKIVDQDSRDDNDVPF